MKKERLWTRDFTLAVLSGVFASTIIYTLLTTMALYSMGRYGAGEGLAGFVASIAMVGGVMGRLFSGVYADRIGRRRVAVTASILGVVICALYFFPVGVVPFLAIRFFHGVMGSCVHNTMATAVIDFIPPARRAEGIGLYSLSYVIAMALGPWLAMFIVAHSSYTALWFVNIAFAIASMAFLLAVRFAPTAFTKEQEAKLRKKTGVAGVLEKSAMPLALTILLLSLCYTAVGAFIETYAKQVGSAWVATVFFLIYSLFILVLRPMAGRLIDRHGENFVMVPSFIIYMACLAAMGLAGMLSAAYAAVLLIAAAVLMAFGYGLILPFGQAIAIKYAEPFSFSKITSTYFSFSEVGMGIGAFIFGLIAAGIGFSNMYFVAILFVLTGFFLYWLLHGRSHRPPAERRGDGGV